MPWSRGSRPVKMVVQMRRALRRPQGGQRPEAPRFIRRASAGSVAARDSRLTSSGPRPSIPIRISRRGGLARSVAGGRARARRALRPQGEGHHHRGGRRPAPPAPRTRRACAAGTAARRGRRRAAPAPSRGERHGGASQRAQELERHRMAVAQQVEPEQRAPRRAGPASASAVNRAAPGSVGREARGRRPRSAAARRGQHREERRARRGVGQEQRQRAAPAPSRRSVASGLRNSVSSTTSAASSDAASAALASIRSVASEASLSSRRGLRRPGYDSADAAEPRRAPGRARAPRRRLRPADLPPSRGRARGARGPVRDDQGGHRPPTRRCGGRSRSWHVDPGRRRPSRCFLKAVGAGSRALADLRAGRAGAVPGPAGRGRSTPPAAEREPLMVAGGYGIAPFHLLREELARRGRAARVFYGGRTAGDLQHPRAASRSWASRWPPPPTTAASGTRAASRSRSRRTSTPAPARSRSTPAGPTPCCTRWRGWPSGAACPPQVSLDPWMGCGVGTCLGCVVRIQERRASSGRSTAAPARRARCSTRATWSGPARQSLAARERARSEPRR